MSIETSPETTIVPAVYRDDVTVELMDFMGTEESIVRAARVSTKGAESRGTMANKGLLRYLYRESHGVPFESVVMTFYIEAPIVTTRQILKHRISSINEESGRYKELAGVFYLPKDERKLIQIGKTGDYVFEPGNEDQIEIFRGMLKSTCEAGWYNYNAAIQHLNIAKEVARFLLPISILYSSLYFTANLRSVLNFLSLRKDWGENAVHQSKAQYEVEMVAIAMSEIVKEKFPTVWEMFEASGYQPV
jgi:thymidylate synthase (FAD)